MAPATLVLGVLGLCLAGLTLACGQVAPAATPTAVVADPFAVVRARAEAAYESGKAHLDRGELEAALVDLDTARTNDADNRQDIQQALAQALSQLAAQTPTAGVAVATPAQRILVVPTVPAASAATPPAARAGDLPALVAWRDPQGRFSVSAPASWQLAGAPQALFGVGTGVVEFHDPTGRAELDVSVDSSARAVSPELYSAALEIALQQQVPGYAAEGMQPENTSGNPSTRRLFTFTQRDSTGADHQARGFQVTVVKGSTPYIISGSAPTELFQQNSPTFDQMVETFQFS